MNFEITTEQPTESARAGSPADGTSQPPFLL